MEYQLGASESIPEAFTRLGAEVIWQIRAGVALGSAEGIHEARKGCKWLRALLRLLRSGLDAEAAATESRRIRRVARMLGTVRDATIRLVAFRSLGLAMFESLEKQLESKARAEHDEQLGRYGQGKLLKAIDSLSHGWKQLRLKRGSWRHVGQGVERSYRRARRAFRRTDRDHTDELLHEWRKRSKDLMYHVRLLEQIKPKKMGKLEKHLDDLSDWLGYDHDLTVLTAYLRQKGDLTPVGRETLLSEVNKHRKEHLTAARHIADIVFKPKPGEFSRRLERWWDRWRE